jgi:hypothetical protein
MSPPDDRDCVESFICAWRHHCGARFDLAMMRTPASRRFLALCFVKRNIHGARGPCRSQAMSNPFRYFNSSPEVTRPVVKMYVRYTLSHAPA